MSQALADMLGALPEIIGFGHTMKLLQNLAPVSQWMAANTVPERRSLS